MHLQIRSHSPTVPNSPDTSDFSDFSDLSDLSDRAYSSFLLGSGGRKGSSGGLPSSEFIEVRLSADSDSFFLVLGGNGGGCQPGDAVSRTSSLISSTLPLVAMLEEMSAGWLRLSSDVGCGCWRAMGISYRALMSSSSSSSMSSALTLERERKRECTGVGWVGGRGG